MNNNKSVLKSRLKDFFESVTLSGLKDRNDLEQIRKIRLVHLLVLTGSTVLYSFAIYTISTGNLSLGFLDALIATILILLRLYLNKTKNYLSASIIGISVIYIFFLYQYITGSINGTGFLWSFILPLFTLFLLGSKHGLLLICIYLLSTIISGFFNFQFQFVYSFEFRLRFPITFLTISLFAYYVELLRENISNRLLDKNDHLNILIEDQKKTELKLIEARENSDKLNTAKSEFLRNMSHELRTPLNHILGFSQLIRDEIPGSVNIEQKEYLDDVLSSSSHLLSLINDLLNLGKIEAGKIELSPEIIDLTATLKYTMSMFKTKEFHKKIKIFLNIGTLPDQMTADKQKIIQILYNLLSNATKFSPIEGAISITADENRENEEIVISIKDEGIGLDRNSLTEIFNTFKQVDSNQNRRFEGTGLGLAITKNFVELHGGRIWAESKGLGRGSTFSFTLPLIPSK